MDEDPQLVRVVRAISGTSQNRGFKGQDLKIVVWRTRKESKVELDALQQLDKCGVVSTYFKR